jgi:hypothetical protein
MFSTDPARIGEHGVMRLYNISEGKWSWVQQYVTEASLTGRKSPYQSATTYKLTPYAFTVSSSDGSNPNKASWEVGDSFGIEATAVRSLNRHFYFRTLGKNKTGVLKVTFAPDGQLKKAKAGDPANDTSIELVEQRGEDNGYGKSSSISVAGGKITYDGLWK